MWTPYNKLCSYDWTVIKLQLLCNMDICNFNKTSCSTCMWTLHNILSSSLRLCQLLLHLLNHTIQICYIDKSLCIYILTVSCLNVFMKFVFFFLLYLKIEESTLMDMYNIQIREHQSTLVHTGVYRWKVTPVPIGILIHCSIQLKKHNLARSI